MRFHIKPAFPLACLVWINPNCWQGKKPPGRGSALDLTRLFPFPPLPADRDMANSSSRWSSSRNGIGAAEPHPAQLRRGKCAVGAAPHPAGTGDGEMPVSGTGSDFGSAEGAAHPSAFQHSGAAAAGEGLSTGRGARKIPAAFGEEEQLETLRGGLGKDGCKRCTKETTHQKKKKMPVRLPKVLAPSNPSAC